MARERHCGQSVPADLDRLSLWVIVCIMAICCALQMTGCAGPEQTTVPDEYAGLKIEAWVQSDTLIVGEPIVATVVVRNVSPSDILIDGRFPPELGGGQPVRFWFEEESGKRTRFYRSMQVDWVPKPYPVTLPPGGWITARYFLTAHPLRPPKPEGRAYSWTCPVPGKFRLVAGYWVPDSGWKPPEVWTGRIESAGEQFVVRKPVDEDEGAFLYQEMIIDLLEGYSSVAERSLRTLESIISEFPSSRYAPYAEFYRARALFGASFYGSHQISCVDSSVAAYRQFMARYPESALTPEAAFAIADVLYSDGRFDEARAQLAHATKLYPHDANVHDSKARQMRNKSFDDSVAEGIRRRKAMLENLKSGKNQEEGSCPTCGQP